MIQALSYMCNIIKHIIKDDKHTNICIDKQEKIHIYHNIIMAMS